MLDGFSSGMVGLKTNCFSLINYANIQSASHKGGACIFGKHEHIQVIWKLYKHALNSLHDIVFHIEGHGSLVLFPNRCQYIVPTVNFSPDAYFKTFTF